MREKLAELKERLGVIADMGHVAALLDWDQSTYMPSLGAEARAQQLYTVSRIAHELTTADVIGALLLDLEPWAASLDAASDEAALVRKAARIYRLHCKLPSEFVARSSQVHSLSFAAWEQAKEASNFGHFLPWLEQVFDIARERAEYLGYTDHLYDPLLDEYEEGMTVAQVDAIFQPLRQELVRLVQAVTQEGRPVDAGVLHGDFDHDTQLRLSRQVAQAVGFDLNRGRIDLTAHPFCTNFGRDDVRITTTVDTTDFTPNFFSVLHECGHGLYEQGSDPALERTPLAGSASLGIHESQSRMLENIVGRSREFWQWATPLVQRHFPQLQQIPWQDLYRAVNRIRPDLIRIDADEVTYNLHIMLRYELEKAVLGGDMRVADLPREWNDRMESYLGVVPATDRQGVLQDVHWSSGLIGYFPTYTLGNLMSVQLFDQALRDHPNLMDEFAQGRFDTLLTWLRQHVHRRGARFTPQTLLKMVTGHSLDATPYIHYLQRKVDDVYGVTVLPVR